jgi:hypothetical protein
MNSGGEVTKSSHTPIWHTGNACQRAISVCPGRSVYESRVDRFRGRPNAPRIADKAPMVPALWVRPGQGYLDTVVGTSYCTVEAVLIEHWPLCRVNGRFPCNEKEAWPSRKY